MFLRSGLLLVLAMTILGTATAQAKVTGRDVEYRAGDTVLKRFFTNPDADSYAAQFKLPLAYDKKADLDSWNGTKIFLKEIFKQKQ